MQSGGSASAADGDGDPDDGQSLLAGVLVSLAASFVSSLGVVLQARAISNTRSQAHAQAQSHTQVALLPSDAQLAGIHHNDTQEDDLTSTASSAPSLSNFNNAPTDHSANRADHGDEAGPLLQAPVAVEHERFSQHGPDLGFSSAVAVSDAIPPAYAKREEAGVWSIPTNVITSCSSKLFDAFRLGVSVAYGICLRNLWYIGFTLYIIPQLFGSVLALIFLSPLLVAPLGSAGLVFNVIFSNLIMHTRITRNDVIGTLLIIVGGVIVSFVGSSVGEAIEHGDGDTGPGKDRTIGDIIKMFDNLRAKWFFGTETALLVVLAVAALYIDARMRHRALASSRSSSSSSIARHRHRHHESNVTSPSSSVYGSLSQSPSVEHLQGQNQSAVESSAEEPLTSIHLSTGLTPSSSRPGSPISSTSPFDYRSESGSPSHERVPLLLSAPTPQHHRSRRHHHRSGASDPALATASSSRSSGKRHRHHHHNRHNQIISHRKPKHPRLAGLLYAIIGGITASQTLVLTKSGIDIIFLSFLESSSSPQTTATMLFALVLLLLLALTVVAQLTCLNLAVARLKPLLAVPVFYTVFTVLSVLNGLVGLGQAEKIEGGGRVVALLAVGIVVIVLGVWVLSVWGGGTNTGSGEEGEEEVVISRRTGDDG